MRAISLFSGAGGMDVGFRSAGFDVVVANDRDHHACNTFRANHHETRMLEGDVAEYLNTLAGYAGVDVIFGGPPCQGFSVAGKMDPCDVRSRLVFSFCDVVEAVKPKAFVMENVKSLAVLRKFDAIRDALLSRFRVAGYSVHVHVLNALDFGVPQSRERVFFIGVRDDITPKDAPDIYRYRRVAPPLRDVLLPLGSPGTKNNSRVCRAKITVAKHPILRKSPYSGMLFNGQGRPLNPDGWSGTLPASMGGNRTPIIDDGHMRGGDSWVTAYHEHLLNGGKPQDMGDLPSHLRRLTIDEAARIQTFPPEYNWTGPHSKVYSQIGNAVPCFLAEAVAKHVRDTLG